MYTSHTQKLKTLCVVNIAFLAQGSFSSFGQSPKDGMEIFAPSPPPGYVSSYQDSSQQPQALTTQAPPVQEGSSQGPRQVDPDTTARMPVESNASTQRSRSKGPKKRSLSSQPTTGAGSDSQKKVEPATETPTLPPPPIIETLPPWNFTLSQLWMSDYYFRGISIFDRVSSDEGSGLWGVGLEGARSFGFDEALGLHRGSFRLQLNYNESLGRQWTNGDLKGLEPNVVSRNEDFETGSRTRYTEFGLTAATQYNFTQHLSGLVGFNWFKFGDGDFWVNDSTGAVNHASEVFARLAMSDKFEKGPLSGWQSSLGWYWDFDGFDGQYLDWNTKVRTREVPLGPVTAALEPSVTLSYDMDYNREGDGWNALEFGLAAPVRLNSYLTLEPSANYVMALADDAIGRSRADDGWWFGVSLRASWPGAPTARDLAQTRDAADPKAPPISVPSPPTSGWSLSAGAGWRALDASFGSPGVAPFDPFRIFQRQRSVGDLFLADNGRSAYYRDGSVTADGGVTADGSVVSGTGLTTGGEISGEKFDPNQALVEDGYDGGRQRLFTSDRFSYRDSQERFGTEADDEDRVLYPYLSLKKDIYSFGPQATLSLGSTYAFTKAEMDSGTSLSAFSNLYQTSDFHTFIYDVDELTAFFSGSADDTSRVIIDGDGYEFAAGHDPQQTRETVEDHMVKVASFVNSGLKVSMHELTVPLELSIDSSRWHLGVGVGPTLNRFDYDLHTEVWDRSLSNFDPQKLLVNQLGYEKRAYASYEGDERATVPSSAATAEPRAQTRVPEPAGGGGRGGDFRSPKLPGAGVGYRAARGEGQEFALGVATQVSVQFDLDESDRWYLEAWGRYNWVDDVTVSNGLGSVEIDASSASFGLGVGLRF